MTEDEKVYAEHVQAMVVRRMDSIDNLALTGLRSLIIINGGAIIALFTLLAQGAQSPFVQAVSVSMVVWASAAFAGGLCFAILATLLGYYAQQLHHALEQEVFMILVKVHHPEKALDQGRVDPGNTLIHTAGVSAGLSLALFLAGATLAVVAALNAAS